MEKLKKKIRKIVQDHGTFISVFAKFLTASAKHLFVEGIGLGYSLIQIY